MTIGTLNEINRDNWVERQLKEIPPGKSLIDIGAGPCRYKKFCTHLDYTSQDFSQYNGIGDQSGLQNGTWSYSSIDIVSDITNIPVADESFDVALCTEVLEHVPSPVLALREMSRVLKKTAGTTLLLTAPFACLTHQSPYFYSTGFSEYFYKTHLAELGFDVEIEKTGIILNFLPKSYADFHKLQPNSVTLP